MVCFSKGSSFATAAIALALLFFPFMVLASPFATQAPLPQAATSQDADGNIAFNFNNTPSVKVAPASNSAGNESCAKKINSEGAIRYNGSIKNLEYCDGTIWKVFGASMGPLNIITYNMPGAYTYKPTAGATLAVVEVVGGGGGGPGQYGHALTYAGGTTPTGQKGSGGGAGGYAKKKISLAGVNSAIVTVGVGGTVNTPIANNGTASSFGTYCSATGGEGGKSNLTTTAVFGGVGGSGVGGDTNMTGGSGAEFQSGGSSFFGGEGSPGSGGRGTSDWFNGTAGSNGIVIVTEY